MGCCFGRTGSIGTSLVRYAPSARARTLSEMRSVPRERVLGKQLSLRYNQNMAGGRRYDVVLIGGGIIGSSVAMALASAGSRPPWCDIDLSGRLSSSEKNAGGVRATWWQPVNITLCRASIKYYESCATRSASARRAICGSTTPRPGPRPSSISKCSARWAIRSRNSTPAAVNRRVPEIDRLDGIAGATFSPEDGLINPNLLKEHYRSRSRAARRRIPRPALRARDRRGRERSANRMLAGRRRALRRGLDAHDVRGRCRANAAAGHLSNSAPRPSR